VQFTLSTLWALMIAALIGQTPARPVKPPPASAKASPTRVERQVPFEAGETLTFDISWSDYLTAATAIVTVKDKRPSFDSTAYYLVAEGQPVGLLAAIYSVYYKVDSLLDVYTLLPQRASVFSQEGGRRRMQVTRFNQAARRATYEMTTATVYKRELHLTSPAHDPLSALYILRTLPMRPGESTSLAVVNEGVLSNVKVTVAGRETLETPLGRQAAWKLIPRVLDSQGRPAGDELAIWISDDSQRLPLRIDAKVDVGVFRLVLREARN
jgi:Protein of unknown function (DUF3108)